MDSKVQKDSGLTLGDKPCPAPECAIADAVENAKRILEKIDERWPAPRAEAEAECAREGVF